MMLITGGFLFCLGFCHNFWGNQFSLQYSNRLMCQALCLLLESSESGNLAGHSFQWDFGLKKGSTSFRIISCDKINLFALQLSRCPEIKFNKNQPWLG